MEWIEFLFVAPWKLMSVPITLFGYTFTLAEIYLLAFIIGVVGVAIYLISD